MTGWAILVVAMPVALALSLFTRRGRCPRARRAALDAYRRYEQPAVIRNGWFVMPVLAGGSIPLLIAVAPLLLGITVPTIPIGLKYLVGFGTMSYLFFLIGTVLVLMYRPPRWLVPGWVVEDDERTGFTPPGPGLFDRAFLLLGLLFLAGGVAALAVLIAAEVL